MGCQITRFASEPTAIRPCISDSHHTAAVLTTKGLTYQTIILYTFIRNECRKIQNEVEKKSSGKENATPTLNTELAKNYNAMQGLL